MTAPSVASSAAVSATPRSAPVEVTPDSAAQGHFNSELKAAKERTDPPGRDSGPMGPREHEENTSAQSLSKVPRDPPVAEAEPAPTQAQTIVTLVEAVPSHVTVPVAPVRTAADEVETGTAGDPENTGEQAGSALAGMMLSLVGPAVAGVLRGAEAATGKPTDPVAARAPWSVGIGTAAALLPENDAASVVPFVMTSVLTARETLMPSVGDAPSPDSAALVALPAAPAAAATPALPVLQLAAPAGNLAFGQELGQHVAWLGGQNIKQARIQLRPEELGALDVKVTVNHGRVDVVFHAQHAGAVAAVQQSLPQLDQMLAQHGLSLGNAEVSQQNQGENQDQSADRQAAGSDGSDDAHPLDGALRLRQVGLVDAFA